MAGVSVENSNLSRHVAKFGMNSAQFSDVSIRVQGKIFHCHKLILLQSEYFRSLILNWTESNAGKIELTVDHPSVTVLGFDLLLRYLYGAELELNEDNVVAVLLASSYLNVSSVSEICAQYISTSLHTLSPENFLYFFRFGKQFQEDPAGLMVRKATWAYLCSHAFDDLRDILPDMEVEDLSELLKCDHLWCASEFDRYTLAKQLLAKQAVQEPQVSADAAAPAAQQSTFPEVVTLDQVLERLQYNCGGGKAQARPSPQPVTTCECDPKTAVHILCTSIKYLHLTTVQLLEVEADYQRLGVPELMQACSDAFRQKVLLQSMVVAGCCHTRTDGSEPERIGSPMRLGLAVSQAELESSPSFKLRNYILYGGSGWRFRCTKSEDSGAEVLQVCVARVKLEAGPDYRDTREKVQASVGFSVHKLDTIQHSTTIQTFFGAWLPVGALPLADVQQIMAKHGKLRFLVSLQLII